ncbi:MAG: D-alanyl-D-alanine carboxypeptidase/D-alanyl-D-alanine-endopeptidase, partial [Polyangiaceae bacterium]|nr:D-alanyl-D-alanine carboxypeptidase/D-alanyl-D-alanine-endopeptidase [Polyangiaceae bacterium]
MPPEPAATAPPPRTLDARRATRGGALLLLALVSACALPPPPAEPVCPAPAREATAKLALPIAPVLPSPAPAPATPLGEAIDALLRDGVLPRTTAGIRVLSLATGATLYEHDAERLLAPASNLKLLTAAGALGILGADHELETTLSVADDGRTLFLRGCGDSLLRSDELAALAGEAASRLDAKRSYVLKADLSCFDDLYWGKGWMWDDEPDPDAMYLSPLSVNGNTVVVKVEPADEVGDKPKVSLIPRTRAVHIDNRAKTVAEKKKEPLEVERRPGDRDNLVRISGPIERGADPVERRISVWAPQAIALEIVQRGLEARNVKLEPKGYGRSPARVTTLARRARKVGELVRHMLKTSHNLTAECLLKYLAHHETGRAGSAEDGISAIRSWLAGRGVPVDELVWVDGSGLSRYNLVTAAALARLLSLARTEPGLAPLEDA